MTTMVLRTSRRRDRGAFTLMEMLVVVAIIVMLAGVGAWGYMRYLEQARESTAKLQITHLSEAVEAYKVTEGEYPESLQALTQRTDSKAAALEAKDLLDPWQQPYVYEPQNLNQNTLRPRISSSHQTGGTPLANW
jgi:general secretion pathway protein G